jgi:hypothetical protein
MILIVFRRGTVPQSTWATGIGTVFRGENCAVVPDKAPQKASIVLKLLPESLTDCSKNNQGVVSVAPVKELLQRVRQFT